MTTKQKKRLRNLLISIIGPVLYLIVKFLYPGIPIPQADFITLILAILGIFIGGWNGIQLYANKR